MKQVKYIVASLGPNWFVQRDPEHTKAGPFDTQEAAVWYAVGQAGDEYSFGQSTQVLVQKEDGTLRAERTYGESFLNNPGW